VDRTFFTGAVLTFLRQGLVGQIWALLKETIDSFLEDEALTRGAAIAFYTVTSIGPVLFIVVAIAGLRVARCGCGRRRHVPSLHDR
jgi:uncharacterized BrkB/YihY/UPF0761 family membrane protein